MKRTVLTFGVIAGLIVSTVMLATMAMYAKNPDMDHSMWLGYASMLLAFSMIFVGVKNYRDKYSGGQVSFGKAFTIGLYITIIASTCYVVAWMIDYYFFIPDFMDQYAAHDLNKAREAGASAAELAAKTKEMEGCKEMYKNPLFVVLFTYAEILPVGLLVSAITALILKRKPVLQPAS